MDRLLACVEEGMRLVVEAEAPETDPEWALVVVA